jgi:pantothenate kinase
MIRMPQTLEQLVIDVLAAMRRRAQRRYVLGVAGVPGSGKSTLANAMAGRINAAIGAEFAAVVPMDGFHRTNAELDAMGLRDRKGAPETFNANAFVEAVRQVAEQRADDDPIHLPGYDREAHEPLPDAIEVQPGAGLIVVEGNYLLLDDEPWHQLGRWLDAVWYIDVDTETALHRVRGRHKSTGWPPNQADHKLLTNDRPNAERIAATADRADRRVSPEPPAAP